MTNSRLEELGESVRSLGECICPWLRKFKVSYFRHFRNPETKLKYGEWTEEEIMAYNRADAARRVTKENNIVPALRPGKNCFVTRVIGG